MTGKEHCERDSTALDAWIASEVFGKNRLFFDSRRLPQSLQVDDARLAIEVLSLEALKKINASDIEAGDVCRNVSAVAKNELLEQGLISSGEIRGSYGEHRVQNHFLLVVETPEGEVGLVDPTLDIDVFVPLDKQWRDSQLLESPRQYKAWEAEGVIFFQVHLIEKDKTLEYVFPPLSEEQDRASILSGVAATQKIVHSQRTKLASGKFKLDNVDHSADFLAALALMEKYADRLSLVYRD